MTEAYVGVDIPGGEPVSGFPDALTVTELSALLGVSVPFLVSMCALHSLAVAPDSVVIQPQAERISKVLQEA